VVGDEGRIVYIDTQRLDTKIDKSNRRHQGLVRWLVAAAVALCRAFDCFAPVSSGQDVELALDLLDLLDGPQPRRVLLDPIHVLPQLGIRVGERALFPLGHGVKVTNSLESDYGIGQCSIGARDTLASGEIWALLGERIQHAKVLRQRGRDEQVDHLVSNHPCQRPDEEWDIGPDTFAVRCQRAS